mmetsp:Transcript_126255/g.218739  ORF Transcript_126255/g.218739 Transcript_126255/m.218739 type:complete len:258 (-) Transcript_126255:1426-2199(-)
MGRRGGNHGRWRRTERGLKSARAETGIMVETGSGTLGTNGWNGTQRSGGGGKRNGGIKRNGGVKRRNGSSKMSMGANRQDPVYPGLSHNRIYLCLRQYPVNFPPLPLARCHSLPLAPAVHQQQAAHRTHRHQLWQTGRSTQRPTLLCHLRAALPLPRSHHLPLPRRCPCFRSVLHPLAPQLPRLCLSTWVPTLMPNQQVQYWLRMEALLQCCNPYSGLRPMLSALTADCRTSLSLPRSVRTRRPLVGRAALRRCWGL